MGRTAVTVAAVLLLAGLGLRIVLSARGHSVTVDEFAHLPAGLVYLVHHDFSVYSRSPPLGQALQALPALLAHPVLPTRALQSGQEASAWVLGYDFQDANRAHYRELFDRARLVSAVLGVLLALAVFLWARRVWGDRGGLVALALVAFDPNVVAHAGLVTTDGAFCLAAVAALGAVSFTLERPGTRGIALAGLLLGLAQLTKFTALLLYPAALVAAFLAARPLRPALLRLAAAFLLSLGVVNLGYLGHDSFRCLDGYRFQSRVLKHLPSWRIPVPLPGDYVRGFDLQTLDAESFYPSYLNGRVYEGDAPWYYDLEAFLLKTPLAELLVLALAVGCAWAARHRALVPLALWAAAAAILVAVASVTELNLGVRYLLLLYPLGALAAGSLADRIPRLIVALLLLHATESLAAFGGEISYFNLAASGRGEGGGIRYLAESNLDWGQDLTALKRTLDRLGAGKVGLAYFGRVDPRLYGIEFELLRLPLAPGYHAVSANFVAGIPYLLTDLRADEVRWTAVGEFDSLRSLTPVARAGSIYVYHVPEP